MFIAILEQERLFIFVLGVEILPRLIASVILKFQIVLGSRIAIASSKWVLINTDTKAIAKVTPDIISAYGPVDAKVFDDEIKKLKEPEEPYTRRFDYTILRRDLDTNKHVNNLNYVDFALETLPEEVYETTTFHNIEVMYKKQCILGDKISCLYTLDSEGKHVITMKSDDLENLHAIIVLS